MSIEDAWRGARTGPGTRWVVRWREGDRQRKKRFAVRAEAEKFEAKLRLAPEVRLAQEGRQLTVATMMATWLATKRDKKQTTRDAYAYDAAEVIAEFGTRLAASVQPSEVRTWAARDAGISRRRRSLAAMNQAYRVAMADGVLTRSPCVGIAAPKVGKREPRFLTWEALGVLAREAGEWAPLVYLLGTTGLRIGEAAALKVGDVDPRGVIRVREAVSYTSVGAVIDIPKSNKSRAVPVPPGVMDLLPIEGRSPDEWLWVGAHGGRLHVPSWRRRVFQPAAERAGLGRLSPHTLRHTAATIAIHDGATVADVQQMLGHATPAVTLGIYTHAFERSLDAVAVRMQARMVGPREIES